MFLNIRSEQDARRRAWTITAGFASLAIIATAATGYFANATVSLTPLILLSLAMPLTLLPWITFKATDAAWQSQKSEQALKDISRMDTVTGLINRIEFETQAAKMFDKCRNEGALVSMIVLDIDHLETINREHGFAAGDSILNHAAQLIQQNIQGGVDVSARLGGAEFVMMLPEADHAWANAFAERLRGTLANRPVNCNGELIPISASFGVASILACDTDANTLLKRAEEALLSAKSSGRNKVTISKDQFPIAA